MHGNPLNGITAVVFLLMLVLYAPISAAEEITTDTSGQWQYTLEDDGATIISWVEDESAKELMIPSELDGHVVTRIGKRTFESCYELTRVMIPSSVTSIEANPFALINYASLVFIDVSPDNPRYAQIDGILFDKQQKTLVAYPCGRKDNEYTVPEGVTTIGEEAFAFCDLSRVTLPDSVTNIEKDAFRSSSLASVTIPYGVKSISDQAFRNCIWLAEVVIPDSVTEIGKSAFWHCTALSSITIPDSVISIGQDAFYDCVELTRILIPASVTDIVGNPFAMHHPPSLNYIDVSPDNPRYKQIDGVLFDKELNMLVACPADRDGAYVIPEGVQHIGHMAFDSCWGITSITIPDSVRSIGNFAFGSCWGLESVSIPEGVTQIGYGAFSGCLSLTRLEIPASVTSIEVIQCFYDEPTGTGLIFIDVSADNPRYEQIDGVLFDKLEKTLVSYPNDREGVYAIPETVERIGECAFSISSLVSLTIPDSVKEIGDLAFEFCWDLTSVTIPSSVTAISRSAFDSCKKLTLSVTQGSFAEEYAKENDIPYVIMEKQKD